MSFLCEEGVLFFVAADASKSSCEFIDVAVNSFLSLNEIQITLFSNKFEQLSFAWLFASVSPSTGVFLNT